MARKIQVLVIDDSLFMRRMIADILENCPAIEVIDTAKDGQEGFEKVKELKPDVVTLDYQMPGLDGIATLKKIMREQPTPVVMISAYTSKGGKITLQALSEGAVDYVLKPSGPVSLDIRLVKKEIIEKVKTASQISLQSLKEFLTKRAEDLRLPRRPKVPLPVVVIGSSTGGTKAVELILESLPADFPVPVLIVQHMPAMFTKLFADRLARIAKFSIKEGQDGEIVKANTAYIAPGDWHMKVKSQRGSQVIIELSKEPAVYGLWPSIDILMRSVAEAYGRNAIAIILSGMGADGVEGIDAIHRVGGKTIAQDEKTSVVFGMPKRAIEVGAIDEVLPVDKIAKKIIELLQK